MKRLLVSLVLVVILSLVVLSEAQAAQGNQADVGVLISQGTQHAQVTLSTVNGGRLAKVGTGAFKGGVTFRDATGRQVTVKGAAKLVRGATSFQVFDVTGVQVGTAQRGSAKRVAHLFVSVFTGADFDHHYESDLCTSPSLAISDCLGMWTH